MKQLALTDKESTALFAIGDNALEGIGGDEYTDLYCDNYSWFQPQDITSRTNYSKAQVAGIISALDEKNLIMNVEGDWCLTEQGITHLEYQAVQP